MVAEAQTLAPVPQEVQVVVPLVVDEKNPTELQVVTPVEVHAVAPVEHAIQDPEDK